MTPCHKAYRQAEMAKYTYAHLLTTIKTKTDI